VQLVVYGPGRVEPSTLRELRPGLLYSVAVAISPDAQYGRIILLMGRGFCTDAAGHPFTRTANSTFTLHFGTPMRTHCWHAMLGLRTGSCSVRALIA
jgi:hypothetical protein